MRGQHVGEAIGQGLQLVERERSHVFGRVFIYQCRPALTRGPVVTHRHPDVEFGRHLPNKPVADLGIATWCKHQLSRGNALSSFHFHQQCRSPHLDYRTMLVLHLESQGDNPAPRLLRRYKPTAMRLPEEAGPSRGVRASDSEGRNDRQLLRSDVPDLPL